jgi:hypothetical protein
MDSIQLGIIDSFGVEWDNYVTKLRSSGIFLNPEIDKLNWSWNRVTGKVTAKLAYQSLLFVNNLDGKKWWYKAIWSVKIPVKMICFMWLCIKDCILTGINFQKRGGIGPSVCAPCLKDEETTTHLFVDCQNSQHIWVDVLTTLRIDSDWKSPPLRKT